MNFPGTVITPDKMNQMHHHFFIRLNNRYVRIDLQEVLYVEGCRNYVKIVTLGRTYMALSTMKRVEDMLPPDLFVRIHKSYIIALSRIDSFDASEVLIGSHSLPIGAQYKNVLTGRVLILQEGRPLTVCSINNSKEGVVSYAV